MADRKINIRSPFYYKAEPTGTLVSCQLELYVHTGDLYDDSDLKYTITKKPLSGKNYVVFEISELVRDFLDVEFDGIYNSQILWVVGSVEITTTGTAELDSFYYGAYDGYGYHEDGINPELKQGYLQSNNIIYRLDDHNVRIPLDNNQTDSAVFLLNGEIVRSETFTYSEISSEQIKYFNVGNSDADNFTQRVLSDGGEVEMTRCLIDFLGAEDVGKVDEVRVTSGNDLRIIKIITEPCSKYTPYKVVFVNKFGALQDIYFSRKSIKSINTSGETYKSNLLNFDTLSYDVSKHQYTSYNKMGRESIVLNTDFLSEEYNEVMKQLMLSEKVWIIASDDDEVYPVVIKSQDLVYKTGVNDKLTQYTMEFEFAYDKINNIR